MYKKDLLKRQKILIVMYYICGWNNSENQLIKSYYINNSEEGEEYIKITIQRYEIELEIVTNYKDEINSSGTRSYCDYYSTWVISGRPYNEMPNGGYAGLVAQFIKLLNIF